MRVQRVLMPDSVIESWTLLGDDYVPVEPVERFLAYLALIERSPNTVKAYAHDLKDWWTGTIEDPRSTGTHPDSMPHQHRPQQDRTSSRPPPAGTTHPSPADHIFLTHGGAKRPSRTNLDVATKDKAAAVEYWYRHRSGIDNVFRHSKHGAALRHLPSGYVEVNTAWMRGALLAAAIAAWLHQLTATEGSHGRLSSWGTREGNAMIVTLRHRLSRVPARLVSHAGHAILRLPPGQDLLAEILARLRALPAAH